MRSSRFFSMCPTLPSEQAVDLAVLSELSFDQQAEIWINKLTLLSESQCRRHTRLQVGLSLLVLMLVGVAVSEIVRIFTAICSDDPNPFELLTKYNETRCKKTYPIAAISDDLKKLYWMDIDNNPMLSGCIKILHDLQRRCLASIVGMGAVPGIIMLTVAVIAFTFVVGCRDNPGKVLYQSLLSGETLNAFHAWLQENDIRCNVYSDVDSLIARIERKQALYSDVGIVEAISPRPS